MPEKHLNDEALLEFIRKNSPLKSSPLEIAKKIKFVQERTQILRKKILVYHNSNRETIRQSLKRLEAQGRIEWKRGKNYRDKGTIKIIQ